MNNPNTYMAKKDIYLKSHHETNNILMDIALKANWQRKTFI